MRDIGNVRQGVREEWAIWKGSSEKVKYRFLQTPIVTWF